MGRLKFIVFAITLSPIVLPASVGAQSFSCPARRGKPGKPLIASPETARAIFLAVEKDFFPRADKARFPDIAAKDRGQWWSVFRSRTPRAEPNGDHVTTAGGGQLSMRIEKCDGKISHVYFSR